MGDGVTVLKVDGIGNMVSIKGLQKTLKDGMLECDYGNSTYKAYNNVYRILRKINKEYEDELVADLLISELLQEIFNK